MLKFAVAAMVPLIFLAGCQGVSQSAMSAQKPPSAALRAQIVNKARDYLFDPYSVRDAEISNVVMLDAKRNLGAVCVKANAKNQLGGYTGRQATSVRVMNGNVVGALPNASGCNNPQLKYHPFPELEAL